MIDPGTDGAQRGLYYECKLFSFPLTEPTFVGISVDGPAFAMKMLDVPCAVLDSATLAAGALAAEAAIVALSALRVGDFATIHSVLQTDNDTDRDLVMRLIEIGFVPGERVRVVAVGHPGGQPIAVRLAAADSGRRNLNGATFAMRRHEADFIRVVPDTGA